MYIHIIHTCILWRFSFKGTSTYLYMCTNRQTHPWGSWTRIWPKPRSWAAMRWLRFVGSLKFQVSFAKEPYTRDNILQKRPIIWWSLLIEPPHMRISAFQPWECDLMFTVLMSHVTRMNESCLTYAYVMCHMCVSHAAHVNSTHHTHDTLTSRVAYVPSPCRTHEHTWAHMSTHTHTQTWAHMSTHISTHEHAHTHMSTHEHTHTHMSTHEHTHTHISTHETHEHTHTHTHTRAHTLTHQHIRDTWAHTHTHKSTCETHEHTYIHTSTYECITSHTKKECNFISIISKLRAQIWGGYD